MTTAILSSSSKVTSLGIRYTDYLISNDGDRTRVLVPRTLVKTNPENVVLWLFHGSGSSEAAIDGGHKGIGDKALAEGWIVVSPNLFGSIYTASQAMVAVRNFDRAGLGLNIEIGHTLAYGTSHGGSQASWLAAKNPNSLVTNLRAIYCVNGVWDIEADPVITRSALVFPDDAGNDIATRNPAKQPQSVWGDDIIRLVYDDANGDTIVYPSRHALPFKQAALAAGANVTTRTHQNGHSTPSFAGSDAVAFFKRVLAAVDEPVDPPVEQPTRTLLTSDAFTGGPTSNFAGQQTDASLGGSVVTYIQSNSSAWRINSSGQLEGIEGAGGFVALAAPADFEFEVTIPNITDASGTLLDAIDFRRTQMSAPYDSLRLRKKSDGSLSLSQVLNGSESPISNGTTPAGALKPGGKIRVRAIGPDVEVFVNDVIVLDTTTSITGSGYAGVTKSNSVSEARYDNLKAYSVTA